MPSTLRSARWPFDRINTRASRLPPPVTTSAKPADAHRTWRAGRVLLALTSVFAAIAVCGSAGWRWISRRRRGGGRLQDETVPWTIERQRPRPQSRTAAPRGPARPDGIQPGRSPGRLFLVHVLSAQPGMADDRARQAWPPRSSVSAAGRGPGDAGRHAGLGGASSRLRLMADDLSVEGAASGWAASWPHVRRDGAGELQAALQPGPWRAS